MLIAVLLLVARRAGAALAGARRSLAAVVARSCSRWSLYYAHFLDTYRTELARIGARNRNGGAGRRRPRDRATGWRRCRATCSSTSASRRCARGLGRRRARGSAARAIALTLTTAGWVLTCRALFLVLGILTPVDMRYYLAAIPVVAIAAGAGRQRRHGPRAGTHASLAAALLAAWRCVGVVRAWWATLG